MLPEAFPPIPLDLVQREGRRGLWSRVRCTRARFCLLGSFVDWGDGSCSLAANSCYLFMSRLALPPHLCTFDKVMRWESRQGSFFFFWLCSWLSLPPHLCTLSEVVRRVRLPSAAPDRFPPWPPDLRLERQGGYLSPLLVEWLSLAVLLLTLSFRLPFSVKRSRRCERGSSR